MTTSKNKGKHAVQSQVDNAIKPGQTKLVVRRMSDVRSKPIDWLWKGRIARGKISIIAGDPGLGKSQLTALMGSTVTNGSSWPVDHEECPSGSVVFLSAEDDAADTIRPRLEAVEADLERVYILDAVNEISDEGGMVARSVNIKKDIQNLANLLEQIGDVALVIIDPISAYLGGTDSHKNADIRALLAPLSELASKYNVAIVGITHLNKGQSKQALQRVTGSLAFVAAARAAYIVAKDPNNHDRRFLLPIKNNIGNDSDGFAFSITNVSLSNGIQTSKIVFEDHIITDMADDVLNAFEDGEQSALDDAMQFLDTELGTNGLSAKKIKELARHAGIAVATLHRAKKAMNIQSIKVGVSWTWMKPNTAEDDQGTL